MTIKRQIAETVGDEWMTPSEIAIAIDYLWPSGSPKIEPIYVPLKQLVELGRLQKCRLDNGRTRYRKARPTPFPQIAEDTYEVRFT